MRGRAITHSAFTCRAFTGRFSFWLFCLSCLISGCGYFAVSHPPLSPAELTPEGVQSRLVAPVTLDPAEKEKHAGDEGGPSPSRALNGTAAADHLGADSLARFTLQEAIAFGLQNNPRLLAALAGIERAQGQEQAAFAPFLPELDLLSHGGVTSEKLGPASAGATGIILPSGEGTRDFAQVEVQLQWTVWDFGRTAGRYQQAAARTRIAELQSARALETVAFDVASAYMEERRATAFRRIRKEAVRRAEAILKDTRARRDAGVAQKDDVLRAQVQLAAAQEDLDVAGETVLAAIARLNHAMGRNASLPLELVNEPSARAFDLSLVDCLEIAAGSRREIGIAQEAVAAAQSGRQATAAEFLPKAYVLASAGTIGGQNILSGPQEGAGLHIDLPLFAGGRRQGDLRVADAEVRQEIAQSRAILDGVSLQVTLAYLAVVTARQRIALDRPAITEAREYLRLVGNRYRNGQATPTDIVDAEVALTRAQQRLVAAMYEYRVALVSLDYAVGNPQGQRLEALADGPPKVESSERLPAPRPLPKGD